MIKLDKCKNPAYTYSESGCTFYIVPVTHWTFKKNTYNLIVETVSATHNILGREISLDHCKKLIKFFLDTQESVYDTYFQSMYLDIKPKKNKKKGKKL